MIVSCCFLFVTLDSDSSGSGTSSVSSWSFSPIPRSLYLFCSYRFSEKEPSFCWQKSQTSSLPPSQEPLSTAPLRVISRFPSSFSLFIVLISAKSLWRSCQSPVHPTDSTYCTPCSPRPAQQHPPIAVLSGLVTLKCQGQLFQLMLETVLCGVLIPRLLSVKLSHTGLSRVFGPLCAPAVQSVVTVSTSLLNRKMLLDNFLTMKTLAITFL